MGTSAVPHIELTNKLLKGLSGDAARIREEVGGQTKVLAGGLQHVLTAVAKQTETLGEMRIIELQAELQTLNGLIDLEKKLVLEGSREDEDERRRLEFDFQRSQAEIASARGEKVDTLLAPYLSLHEQDFLEGVVPHLVAKGEVLENAAAALDRQLECRNANSMEMMKWLVGAIDNLEAARGQLAEQFNSMLVPDEIRLPESARAFLVPFYLVEIEEGASIRHEVIGPSTASPGRGEFAGPELRALPGWQRVAEFLRRSASAIISTLDANRNELSVSTAHGGEFTGRGGLGGLATTRVNAAINRRPIEAAVGASPALQLEED